jgi:hypothetical protein
MDAGMSPPFAGAAVVRGERLDRYAAGFSSASELKMCFHNAPRCNAL